MPLIQDATANDVSNKAYVVKGFPTLYFKQAGEGGEVRNVK